VLFVTVKLVKQLEVCCYTTLNVFSVHLSGDGGKSGKKKICWWECGDNDW